MGIGALGGVVFAIIVELLIPSTLIAVQPLDPRADGAGLAIFGLFALADFLIPARRALRIDPAIALRWE
jgi:ABC-type antimicrobial peptide transport system permease subunit